MKTISDYTIFCTEEQTLKALELSAPIELESEYYNPTEFHFKLDSPIPCSSFTNGYHYAKCPTAEQMIGWLEEQGLYFHFDHLNLYSCMVSNSDSKYIMYPKSGSRKEATTAAIDAALEYLTKNKK